MVTVSLTQPTWVHDAVREAKCHYSIKFKSHSCHNVVSKRLLANHHLQLPRTRCKIYSTLQGILRQAFTFHARLPSNGSVAGHLHAGHLHAGRCISFFCDLVCLLMRVVPDDWLRELDGLSSLQASQRKLEQLTIREHLLCFLC